MAINGLITDIGLTQSQIALNNQGWFIFPTRFEVADTAGVFSKTRVGARIWEAATSYAVGDLVVPTTPGFGFYFIVSVAGTSGGSEPDWPTSSGSVTDGGVTWDFVGATTGGLEAIWFAAAISTRIEAPPNTLEIVLTIPPGADPSNRDIEEIYIFAEDQLGVEFLLGIGQPDVTILYDKDGTTSLRLAITLTNVNISGLFVFKYTQATEIAEHSVDPNAHPDIRDILQLQFNLAANGDMGVDRNPGGFALGAKTFGFGPADWEGQLTATGAVSGTLIRKTTSAIEGSRSMHFSGISLTGSGEELHVRKRIRSDTARLLSNNPWSVSTAYVVGDIVVPTASPLLRFRATIAGTSDSGEPTWPSLVGDTIVDGGVTWEAILGNFSMSWRAFQDTGITQFAIITLSTPDSLDDFGGATTALLTTGATDHPMLDGVVSTVERAAIVLPNVDNGLEIDIKIDTGVLSSKNFEFSRFKFEPTEKVSPFVNYPHGIENIITQGYLEAAFAKEFIIGLQADVDKGLATNVINDIPSLTFADGDRILLLEGTHILTASISKSQARLVIKAISPSAIIDLDSTYTFTLSGDDCLLDVPFIGMTGNSLVLSGNGSRFLGTDELLANIDVSGNSWALTGDGLETSGFSLLGSGDVTFNSLKITSLGSELLPSIAFAGDPDTGIYSPGADQLSLVTGGVAALDIDASQNVSIPNGIFSLGTGGLIAAADLDIGPHKFKAEQLESDIVTGTAPFIVASTTVVANLNADLLDGQSQAFYRDANNLNAGVISSGVHGTQTVGTLHADAIPGGADGFMTGSDKTKLDGIATLANRYIHSLNSTTDINAQNAVIIDVIDTDGEGHITVMNTRTLTAANIGAAPTSHTHAGADITGLTVNRVLVSNGSGVLIVDDITPTELGLLNGMTGFTGTGATFVKSAGPTISGLLSTDSIRVGVNDNLRLNNAGVPTGLLGGIAMLTGTAASAALTNGMSMWAADWNGAGTSVLHMFDEEGFSGVIPKVTSGEAMNIKIIEIGDWDMVADNNVSLPHGLVREDIRSVSVVIRHDDGRLVGLYTGSFGSGETITWGGWNITSSNIILFRMNSPADFDTTNFNDIPYNRGWITIFYTN